MSTQNQSTQINFKYGKYGDKEKIDNGTVGFAAFGEDGNTGTFIVKLNDKIYDIMPPSSSDQSLIGAPLVSGNNNTNSYYAKTLGVYHGGTGLDKDTLEPHALYFVPALDGIAENKMIPMNSYIDEQCLTIGDINPNLYNSGLKADNVETLITTVRSALHDFQDIACPMASIHYGGINDAYLELPSANGTLVATSFHSIRPISNEIRNLTAFSQDSWGVMDQLDSLRYESSIEKRDKYYYYSTVNLLIGNTRAASNSPTQGNARGIITLYDNGKNYAQILTKESLTGSIKFYLPDGISNEEIEIYGVGFKQSIKNGEFGIWGQGSSSLPVYIDASGEILPCKNSDLFSKFEWTNDETTNELALSATIAGLTLSALIPIATATQHGVITTNAQTFSGNKTFNGTLYTRNIIPQTSAAYDLGSSTSPWRYLHAGDNSYFYGKAITSEKTEFIAGMQILIGTSDAKASTANGTFSRLYLGNNNSNNLQNRHGELWIFSKSSGAAIIRARSMTSNASFYLPTNNPSYAVWSTALRDEYDNTDQTTGSLDNPVYVNSQGQVIACADNLINIYSHATAPNQSGEVTNYKCKAASLVADNTSTLNSRPVLLTLGTKTNESGNRYGQIRLYSQATPTSGSVTIETRSGLTKDITFFLPPGRKETKTVNGVETTNYITDCYAVWIDQEQSVVGSDTQPVYIDGTGKVLPGYLYAGGTNVTLNGTSCSAQTATFYAPLSGGNVAEGADTQVLIAQGDAAAPIWVNQSTLKATLDVNGKEIIKTYETKLDAIKKLDEAKAYADDIKTDLLGDDLADTFNTLKAVQDWADSHGEDAAALTKGLEDEVKARENAISSLKIVANTGIKAEGSMSADGGLTISGVVASSTASGIVTTGAQTFAGAKTFTGATALSSTLSVTKATTLLDTLSVTGATTIGVENGNTSLIVHGSATINGATTLGNEPADTITLKGKTVLTDDVQYGEELPLAANSTEGQIFFKLI